jgi:uroporphyrinogen decarboxylase
VRLWGVTPDPDVFLRAARRQPTPYTPVWLMRQAGRYMPEYRAMRERHAFLDLCKNSQAAAEVTLQPVEQLGVDAAILFADILLVVEPLGVGLEFARGEGPVIHRPVRGDDAVAQLKPVDVESAVGFVFETVRLVRRALAGRVPLIGFAGAPFTVASYLVEGGPSRDYLHTKRMMYEAPETWKRLMDVLVDISAAYLNGQIAAGAQAVQLFDSWVGVLSGTTALLPLMREAGGDVLGLDWRVDLDAGWAAVGHDRAVQGNLDPALLLARPARFREPVKTILARAGGRPGHIFNLGHGVHQHTPVEHVKALVAMVHDLSDRR